jgi:hypothetical protein
MTKIERNGTIYVQTTVQIPATLRENAHKHKICLSATLTAALEDELKNRQNGVQQ